MKKTLLSLKNSQWLDVVDPNRNELSEIAEKFELNLKTLETCLDPEHLPKFEIHDSFTFLIIRIYDPHKKSTADTIQDLTTKLALLITKNLILTVHRLDQDFIKTFRAKVEKNGDNLMAKDLIKEIITQSIMSYDAPLTDLESKVEAFEQNVLRIKTLNKILKDGFILKRRASVFKKILKLSIDIINKLVSKTDLNTNDFQDLRDSMDTLLFYSEDVLENVNNLIHLHIALTSQKINDASFKTNEVMRTLTVFSIFFLPLNFIAGVYGMNFENIPELKHPFGYYYTIFAMVIISAIVLWWIKRKGLLGNEDT
ncbi:MAG: magnesium and cobalt transport protein [Bdellovibrionaceae bacterium]|nr:magnesium and cobalt transport protein [Pseudobdellovibrionaceae bacterium]